MIENVISGYLDVKISSKSRRGFTPWKAWQQKWCEIRRLDSIENGVELKLKTSQEGGISNYLHISRSATLCRTDSKSKEFAFGIFNLRKTKKPLIFLAGSCESESQELMISIRRMLCIANYVPVGDSNFRISLIDTEHSRAAGLLGLYGVLNATPQEILINDPCTGIPKIAWKWHQFYQFHLAATYEEKDVQKIVVMHTSMDFSAKPGQLMLYCREGPKLLNYLINKGQNVHLHNSALFSLKRFSRSEGDLSVGSKINSPVCFRSQITGSDDSGVPNNQFTDENNELKTKKINLINVGISDITKTPGGSETEDSNPNLLMEVSKKSMNSIPRNESGISLSSGIYEEIPDKPIIYKDNEHCLISHHNHVYENPCEIIIDKSFGKYFKAPPLPPRTFTSLERRKELIKLSTSSSCAHNRCNTLPAKDLSKISQIFNFKPQKKSNVLENEYVVMSPSKSFEKTKKKLQENFYVPMTSPQINLKK